MFAAQGGSLEPRQRSHLKLVYSVPQSASDSAIINGTRFTPHPNGGGLVATSAFVAPSVFVDSDAMVCDTAVVRGEVRIMHRAVVAGDAEVSGTGSIRDDARVDGRAVLRNRITVRRHAHITGSALLDGLIIVDYFAYLGDGTRLFGSHLVE